MKESPKKFNFNKKDIQALPVPVSAKQIYYRDASTRGLALCVARGGTKSFVLYRKVNGTPRRMFLGYFPDMTIEQARGRAAEENGRISNGVDPFDAAQALRNELTVGQLFEEYLTRHAKKSRKRWADTEANFHRYFSDWEDKKVSAITRDMVETRHNALSTERGPYAANRALELIRSVYNKGIQWKLFSTDNPATNITQFPEHARERILQEDEFLQLFAALEKHPDEAFRDFVFLSLLTGARKMNVLSMKWEQVNLERKTWYIPADSSKNGKSQTISLTPFEVEILKKRSVLIKNSEFVFPGEGRTGHYVEPKRAWSTLLRHAGIKNLHLHDLRRSFASYLAMSGASASVVKNALGHKDLKTTLNVYARTVQGAEQEARGKAHDLMLGLGTKRTGDDNVVDIKRKAKSK